MTRASAGMISPVHPGPSRTPKRSLPGMAGLLVAAALLTKPGRSAAEAAPVDVIGGLPCTMLISSRMQGLPSSQWLPFDERHPEAALFGIPNIDWTNEVFNALKARVRACEPTAGGALARMVPTLLSVIERQQTAQVTGTDTLRRKRGEREQANASVISQLQTIQSLPNAQDQVSRLTRLRMQLGPASPAIAEQVQLALADAQSRDVVQQLSAGQARQLQQAEQELRAASEAAAEEAQASQERRPADELAQLRSAALERERKVATERAAADSVRLAAIARERAEVEARRREQAARAAIEEQTARARVEAEEDATRQRVAAEQQAARQRTEEAALAPPPQVVTPRSPPPIAPIPSLPLAVAQLVPPVPPHPALPTAQSLIAAVNSARAQFASAANELAQGAVRPIRARAICAAMNVHEAEGWIGTVTELSSNSQGKGVLRINIGDRIIVGTWNNALSDMLDHTMIETSSPVFGQAVQLHRGQRVRFSGRFFDDHDDCLQEMSVTLAGSIREPEFVFSFSDIRSAE